MDKHANIIAFDLATITGVAYEKCNSSNKAKFASDIWRFYRGKRALCLEERLLSFETKLQELITKVTPDIILYEAPHHRGRDATRSLIGFEITLRVACYSLGIKAHDVHSRALKKWATGNGNANKAMMIARANELSPRRTKIIDDNEADAVLLLKWGREYVEIGKDGEAIVKGQEKPKKKKKCKRSKV
jgi:Holliday junction resolvasome RuvABC endonuclease subunit